MQPTSRVIPFRMNLMNVQSIQIMRGLASILVVLLHISIKGAQYGNGALQGFSIGGSGVDLFFLISGYIMCVSTASRSLTFYQFILLRIRRIMPLYWLVTTVGLAIYLYNPKLVNTSGGETSIWASYVLFPNGKKFLNSNGWTLSYEFFFYFILGFFIHKGTYKALQATSVILSILVVIGLCINYDGVLFDFSTNILYLEFVFGMGCFYFFDRKAVRLDPKYGIVFCVLGSLLLVLEALCKVPDQEKWRGFLWGIPMLSIFSGLLSLEHLIQRSRSVVRSLLLEIGNSSYSLYLVHPFVLSGAAMGLRHFGMASNAWLFSIILLTLSIVVGHLVYLYVEKPLISLIKRVPPGDLHASQSETMEVGATPNSR
ncbi:MAG TPA: acyltransferase [Puia sp.]|nr:acyltransferase [Puia sp.]